MYRNNLIDKLKTKFYKALRFEIELKHLKYYQYLRSIRRDYRWSVMFVVARFPLGRSIGSFLHRDRASSRESFSEIGSPGVS